MDRSLAALLAGTLLMRVSTTVTALALVFYLADVRSAGLESIGPSGMGVLYAAYFLTELVAAPFLGTIADRIGRKPVLLVGPILAAVAVVITGTTHLFPVIFGTRLLEGAAAAATVPTILGFITARTAGNQALRGRAMGLYEIATLGGMLAFGPVVAGLLYQLLGVNAFFVNAGLYLVTLGFFAIGIREAHVMPAELGNAAESVRRLVRLATNRRILLFAPSWIALNAILGAWSSQGQYLITGRSGVAGGGQLLMQGLSPIQMGVGMLFVAAIGGAGTLFWGNAFGRFRRSSILMAGLVAYLGGCFVLFGLNHAAGAPIVVLALLGLGVVACIFFLAGATPAALGLLADATEGHEHDRTAIMGLYSVFLGLGQIAGASIAGPAAEWGGIDGLIWATFGLGIISLGALFNLRRTEHHLEVAPVVVGRAARPERRSSEPAAEPAGEPAEESAG
jgi:MFS family permease